MQSRLKLGRIKLMKIGVYDPYLNTLGGGEKYMLTAASCLSAKHEVFVFWDQDDILTLGQKKFEIDLSRVNLTPNIFNQEISTIRRFLETKKYDTILFLSDGSIPFVAPNLYIHFQFPVDWINTKGFLEKQKIKRIKKIICNSNFTKEHIDKKFNMDTIVLYPPTYFKSKMPKVDLEGKKNIILNVGRYATFPNKASVKKQEFMIDAFKKMCDLGLTNWEFHLVVSFLENDRENVAKLKEKIDKYPIKIYENVSFEKLSEEYKISKIYWHAAGVGEDLVTHPERAEHFGITTVEAMLNGVLPIVIDAGGQKEIVQDFEAGFLWTNAIELIEKTFLVVKDPKLLEKLSKNAIKNAERFSTDSFCQKIINIFN